MGCVMDEKQRIAELVVMLQNGDSSAFDELYKLTNSRAFFVALEITKNDQDAEDILQESYVKMLEKIGSLDKPESFVSWFHHIVANKSKDSLKKKKPTLFEGGEDEAFEVIPDEDTSFSPEENLNQEELRKTVLETIEELSDEKRACVMLMYFEEMSVNEISETLDIPVSTVKNRLFTARKDLKTKFEKRGITSLYSTAPIGVVIWALMRTSEAVSETFGSTEASAKILAGIKASGAVSAASSATAATAATTGAATSAVGSAAAAAGGTVAKAAALTVLQKVTIGVVATAVVGGSTVGVATVVKNKREEESSGVYTEEVTTVSNSYNDAFAQITVSTTDESVLTVTFENSEETETVTVALSTAKQTNVSSTQKKNSSTTRVASTSSKSTEKQNTTSKTTNATKATKPSTTRRDYFPNKTSTSQAPETVKTTAESTTKRKRVTTTEEETTAKAPETTKEKTTKAPKTTETETVPPTEAETVPPTEAETTTQAPKDATVSVDVYDSDFNFIGSFSLDVPAGTTMDWNYLAGELSGKGYDVADFEGSAFGAVAEEGKSYSLEAYVV